MREESTMNRPDEKEILKEITVMLHEIGVPAHVKGHNYLRDGILKVYYDKTYLGQMMRRLYPEIAKEFNTTTACVERGIRSTIEIAWTRSDAETIREIFGNTIDYKKSKPTNSEFIAMIADIIWVEHYK